MRGPDEHERDDPWADLGHGPPPATPERKPLPRAPRLPVRPPRVRLEEWLASTRGFKR